MILQRYIAREILGNTFAITLVLMVVVMSGRLSAYIDEVAAGKLAAEILFPVILARVPEFLELVLPLALFLGVLIGFVQMRQSSELTVMAATGFGRGRTLALITSCSLFIAMVVASFSFYVTPRGSQYVNELIAGQGFQSELSAVTPGRFFPLSETGGVLYAEGMNDARTQMTEVMLSLLSAEPQVTDQTFVLAEKGYPRWSDNGGYYFVLEDGVSYEGTPGDANFSLTRFDRYHRLMPAGAGIENKRTDEQTLFLHQLLQREGVAPRAELIWRLSLPLVVMLLGLMAWPLSRAGPRQSGRFSRVVPGVLIYLTYIVLLNAAREAGLEEGRLEVGAFLGVHLGFIALTLLLYAWPEIARRLFSREVSV